MRTADTTSEGTRARWAITAVFGGNGLLMASLAVRTPSLKLDNDLSPGQLGLVTAMFGASAVLAMQVTGRLVDRVGSGWIVRAVTPLLPVALLGVGLAPGLVSLIVLIVAFGTLHGTLDVTMNAHAVEVEQVLHRHILNGCHAAWSIGAVTGSLLGAGAANADMSLGLHFALLAAVFVPAALIDGRFLLPAGVGLEPATPRPPVRSGWLAGWTREVVKFGAMGATVLTVEAAVAHWSGVYLHEYLGASLGVAALGYTAFTAFQTTGRLVGDRLQARTSAARLLRYGALTAAGGLAVVLLSPWAALSVVGFAVMGLALATPLPVLYGAVGHLGADLSGQGTGAATTVARFTTMTYAGILLAPAIIGWVTELVGLTWTLTGLIPLLAAVAYGAGTVSRRGGPAPAASPEDPDRSVS